MQEHKPYSIKKGIGFGAFGGFVGAIAFTGIILSLPFLFHMPTGIFLHALGLLVMPNIVDDPVLVGMAAFAIILIQGISIGVVFGIVTSKVSGLHPSRKKKGVAMGLATGAIAYFLIYVPMIIAVFPALLSNAVATYPEEKLSLFGLSDYTLTTTRSAYFAGTLGFGIIAYLAYGVIMGGIVTLKYSVYHFVVKRKEDEKEKEREEHGSSSSIHA